MQRVFDFYRSAGLAVCCLVFAIPGRADESIDFFESRIRPMLIRHCYECHSEELAEGNLRLDSKAGWERGGDRGPAIVPGDPASSLIMRAVSLREDKLRMPPEDAGDPLSAEELADLSRWIRHGAIDPREGTAVLTDIEQAAATHWAFQPLSPPTVSSDDNPIDVLIEQQLAAQNFTTTTAANKKTLIRRLTYDLHGLPPTEEQLHFEGELATLVEDLLASPRYGERWGRHWLDVARYSDAKDGVLMYGDARVRPFAYTYRDYVIRAFNDDKPFNQFIREQIAADQLGLTDDSPDLAALGLLTLGRMFDNNRHDVIDDQIDVVTRGFLGLTVSCARCHDHKNDPIPTADYYSLYGVFASSIEPYNRPRIGAITPEGQAFEDEFAAKLAEITKLQEQHYAETLQIARQRTADYLVQVATTEPDVAETSIFFLSLTPDQLRPQVTKRWRQLVARRAFPEDPIFGPWHDLSINMTLQPEVWRQRGIDSRVIDGLVAAKPGSLAEMAKCYGDIIYAAWLESQSEEDPLSRLLINRDGPVWFPITDVASYLSRQPGDAYRGMLGELDAIAVRHRQAAPRAMVLHDVEALYDPVIFQRGDPSLRGNPVPRQFLQVLSTPHRQPFANGSGRLDLANAIAADQNPLTARVWVNRVWMHHFGEPLVENPSDFGLLSKAPVQLELLDYLADFFIKHGWQTKPLHRLILSSRAWQRTSSLQSKPELAEQQRLDPGNSFYWRANRRRLDFEQMRDSLLAVSGELDTTMFGRPADLLNATNFRRTIYAFVERQNLPAMVQTFDVANADTSTARRNMTTVPQQALFALNSSFMLDRSDALAQALVSADSGKLDIAQTFSRVLGRMPSAEELSQCATFLESGSPSQLVQVLFMSNEFMFID
jgi:hypothetical protein